MRENDPDHYQIGRQYLMIVKTYSVFCDLPPEQKPTDHHGVKLCTGWVSQTVKGATEARNDARSFGWKRIKGKDYCQQCAATIEETP